MIKRRDVLKTLAFAGGAMLAKAADVKRVLVMFKCHLDVGFTDTQAGVTGGCSVGCDMAVGGSSSVSRVRLPPADAQNAPRLPTI